jgi:hypothetical protein
MLGEGPGNLLGGLDWKLRLGTVASFNQRLRLRRPSRPSAWRSKVRRLEAVLALARLYEGLPE